MMSFCFTTANAEPSPTPDANTGIEGVITMSPTHGGPIRVNEPSSKPLPNMPFVVENEKGPAASFKTDDQGRFRVLLPPGHYKVTRQGATHAIGKFGPFEVDVVAGKMTKVQWDCDTGLR